MITLLAGGTGAAKLVDGFAAETDPAGLTLVCNTGDDIKLYGLHVSPDVDTILYTLAGMVDWNRGWGIAGDSFRCLESLGGLGHETWFRLGDRDLATHLHRSLELGRGATLSDAVASLVRARKIAARVLPMSNDPVETRIVTPEGDLHFQEFFVRGGWRQEVRSVYFKGIEHARPAPGVLNAVLETRAVVLCPSNPVTSLGPILAVPGLRRALQETRAVVLAVSPIVGGAPVSGPAHKLMGARGWEVSALGVARVLSDVADVLFIDRSDEASAPEISALGPRPVVADIVMKDAEARRRLAREVLREIGAAAPQ